LNCGQKIKGTVSRDGYFFEGLNNFNLGSAQIFLKKPGLSIDTTVNPPTFSLLNTFTNIDLYDQTQSKLTFLLKQFKVSRGESYKEAKFVGYPIYFSILGIAYGFLCQNPRFFMLITFDHGFFFIRIFTLRIFVDFESIAKHYKHL
jgi:hypothetical protein